LGRALIEYKNEGKNEVVISAIPQSNQALFVKVKLENGKLINRKLIF